MASRGCLSCATPSSSVGHMTLLKAINAYIDATVRHRVSISAIYQLYPNGLNGVNCVGNLHARCTAVACVKLSNFVFFRFSPL